jgi:hypothetical protein
MVSMPIDDDQDEDTEAAAIRRGYIVPFSDAMAPFRAQHRDLVVGLAEWCLGQGRPCDRDAAALSFEGLTEHEGPGGYELDRPDVTRLLSSRLHNLVTIQRGLLPEDLPETFWSVLSWVHETGRMSETSAPLEVLLEPLRCYGGLDGKGRPMADGDDIDFGCQCWIPHDPCQPPGLGSHIVGIRPDSYEPLITPAVLHPRRDDPSPADLSALRAFLLRLGGEASEDDFVYAGRVPASGQTPELWLYHFDDRHCRLYTLDGSGRRWFARPDGRRRLGFRWTRGT